MGKRIAIIGASGGLGKAFVDEYLLNQDIEKIYAFSRSGTNFDDEKIENLFIDVEDENSIEKAANLIDGYIDELIIASGILHDGDLQPEKALKDLNSANFHKIFAVNTIGPAIVAKFFIDKFDRKERGVFAVMSARVGSIGDNYLGGWYAYRASKAALNMLLKNISIEAKRKFPELIVAGLHPGTVDSQLSKPFQKNVSKKIFTANESAGKLIKMLESLDPSDSGNVFDYDGIKIEN